jgi:hypothetical protein
VKPEKPSPTNVAPASQPAVGKPSFGAQVSKPAGRGLSHPAFNPYSEVGNEIEKARHEPSAVGRVTPCAPRLQRAGAVFPRRRLPDPLRLKTPPGAAG